jgi:hypothetical protein
MIFMADARIGELTREMAKAPRGGDGGTKSSRTEQMEAPAKRDALAAEGISRKQAAQCEKIAELTFHVTREKPAMRVSRATLQGDS